MPPSAVADASAAGGVDAVAAMSPATSLVSSDASVAPLSDLDEDDEADNDLDEDGGHAEGRHGGHGGRGGGGGRLAALFQTAPPPTGRVINFTRTDGRSHGPAAPLPPSASTSSTAPPALTADQYAKRFGANVRVVGRICTSMGKDLRKDLKMPSYSLPMVHLEVLGQPLPYFADSHLAELFIAAPQRGSGDNPHAPLLADGRPEEVEVGSGVGGRETALRYLAARVAAPHRIACKLHWFTKLLEFSRMYGILTEEVITRGSQFKVEATLLRLAVPHGYAMLSPSLSQVHRQPRIECIPLVMQPKSDFYRHDPVVVLDFRSLYPSIIIAYNLCYSTCLGMVQPQSYGRLGVLPRFKQSDAVLAEALPDDGVQHDGVVFTPNGAMFAPRSTRVGLLPTMVQAVLDARFEVQAALKHIAIPAEDTTMQQRLQEQQLALKMLANVTYGYTAASYTGRMPCVDLAEAIVSLGRQTLQRAIALIHSTPEWRAEVVYGDTDSLFVRLAGRSKADAFRIGQAMADAVTLSNPAPVRLQFEKVLLPCLLLVKKRYAGYMWTSPTQTTPTFLAKGIEVVRRDQCPVTGQVAKRLLRLLFDGASATALRRCYVDAVQRLQSGSANPALCIFRRAVKLGRYRDAGDAHLPLAARLALRQMEEDVALTPYWGERLPYVVFRSTVSVGKLGDQVLHPERLMHLHDTHALDATYYITRNVNSTLDRMLYLVGINVAQWFRAMPRRRTAHAALLNLPTFMAAQVHALRHQLQYRLHLLSPPSPSAAFLPPRLLSPVSRLARLSQLARLMQELCLPPGHSSYLHGGDAARLVAALTGTAPTAAQEVSDGDGGDISSRSSGGGVAHETVSSEDGRSGGAVQPPTVEDLTLSNTATQEVIDVELLLLATQRSRRASAADRAAPDAGGAGVHSVGETVMAAKPRRRWHDAGVQQRRRRTVTLDSFYPRTLCVVCEAEAVSLEDVRRQHAILAHLGIDGRVTEAADAAARPPPPPPRPHPGGTPRRAHDADVCHDPLDHLLPPICTKCWGDPFTLHLHVQERRHSLGRQSAALRGLCARCITSGGDGGAPAAEAYRRAVVDMEDMDAFAGSVLVTARRPCAEGLGYLEGSTPRHILGAVEVSPDGVPRGCVSVDCAVGFEKKWVASQWTQWQAVQAFLQRVL